MRAAPLLSVSRHVLSLPQKVRQKVRLGSASAHLQIADKARSAKRIEDGPRAMDQPKGLCTAMILRALSIPSRIEVMIPPAYPAPSPTG